MSHEDLILAHLKSGKTITPLEALNLFGCFRLSGRILELRQAGYNIETEMIEENKKRFARYFIPKKPIQQTLFDNKHNNAA